VYQLPKVQESKTLIIESQIGENTSIENSCILSQSEIGNNISILHSCVISNSHFEEQISLLPKTHIDRSFVGKFTYIGGDSYISLVNIGRFCSIGPHLLCGLGEHPTNFVSTHPVFYSPLKQCGITFSSNTLISERKRVTIGHDVWIGARVYIRDGISIGNGAIIAAGSIVVKDVPDYAIVGGVPAKLIRYRFSEEHIKKLQEICWWDWSEATLRKAQPIIAQDKIDLFIDWFEKNHENLENKSDLY
jgi:chloramphenicol O-acetyltransferase type B